MLVQDILIFQKVADVVSRFRPDFGGDLRIRVSIGEQYQKLTVHIVGPGDEEGEFLGLDRASNLVAMELIDLFRELHSEQASKGGEAWTTCQFDLAASGEYAVQYGFEPLELEKNT